ncbi:MAG TPA: type IV pilin [Methanoregula sp.]|nr:type IV pilin [Methanoregula sp.]
MKQLNDKAVSPVVGVMLMLVVVIIIAAVVSGFAGSLMGGTKSAPQLAMDVHIANNGVYSTSYFKAAVTSVSAPINTHDLQIVTSWSSQPMVNGAVIKGGGNATPGVTNFNVAYDAESSQSSGSPPVWRMISPQGDGPGVGQNGTETSYGRPYEGTGATDMTSIGQNGITNYTWFGNYNIEAGTVLFAQPFGAKYDGTNFSVGYGTAAKWAYNYGTDSSGATFSPYPQSVDEMQAILGQNWYTLRPGDTVNVKVIHIPSGKVIWQASVPVEGSVI